MPSLTSIPPEARTSPRVRALAAALRKTILSKPDGALIGKESDLCAELGCSRAMLRQVSRQLELQGLLYIRRGPTGGYFGARPEMEAVIEIAAIYFVSRKTTLEEALRSVTIGTIEAAKLAAGCPHSHHGYRAMRGLYEELGRKYPEDTDSSEFIRDEERIDDAIFGMIDAAPLEMFIKILNRFSLAEFGEQLFVRQPERRKLYRSVRMKTMKAILDRDADSAADAMTRTHDLIYRWLPKGARSATVGTRTALR